MIRFKKLDTSYAIGRPSNYTVIAICEEKFPTERQMLISVIPEGTKLFIQGLILFDFKDIDEVKKQLKAYGIATRMLPGLLK